MNDFKNTVENYIKTINPPVSEGMVQIKQEGIASKVPIIRDDLGAFLKMICSIVQPEMILEIGSGISYATHWMLAGSSNSKVIALDSNRDRIERSRFFLEQSGLLNRVELRHCWAEDFFPANHQQFDLVFQDSTKKGYAGMIDQCYRCLRIGGILVADNIFFNGKVFGLKPEEERKYAKGVAALDSFNRLIAQHPGFDCTFLDFSDGTLVAKRIK